MSGMADRNGALVGGGGGGGSPMSHVEYKKSYRPISVITILEISMSISK